MKIVQRHRNDPNCTRISRMWLPMYVAENRQLLKELQQVLFEKYRSAPVTEEVLEDMHHFSIEWIAKKLNIPGLARYLRAMADVEEE